MKYLKLIIAPLFVVLLLGTVSLTLNSNPAEAFIDDGACGKVGGGDVCAKKNNADIQPLVKGIVDILLYVAGAISIIFMLVGAAKFITSAGDPQKAASGRNTLLYAVIGLLVSIFAFAIVQFAANAFKIG